jgi:hypothetical protein
MFRLVAKLSPPVEGVSPPSIWGDPNFVRQQCKDAVENLVFDQGMMAYPALSLGHYRRSVETTLGPVLKIVQDAKNNPELLKKFRSELDSLIEQYYADNHVHKHYLMSRGRKK